MEAVARAKAEKQIEELTRTIESLMDTSVMEALRNQIIELRRQRDDALASDRHNHAERYGCTSKKMKDSDAFDEDDNEPNAGEEFAKIVRGCNDTVSMLPMNMGLSVNKYQNL